MGRRFTAIIELDEDGYYVGSVLELPGCHTQAQTLKTLMERIRETIELYLETVSTQTTSK
jgi:predicted RNase H-like HicB family nuclease